MSELALYYHFNARLITPIPKPLAPSKPEVISAIPFINSAFFCTKSNLFMRQNNSNSLSIYSHSQRLFLDSLQDF